MLIDIKKLAAMLQRSPETIRKDILRNPCAVPPMLILPGTRLLRWREDDIATWLDGHATQVASANSTAKELAHD